MSLHLREVSRVEQTGQYNIGSSTGAAASPCDSTAGRSGISMEQGYYTLHTLRPPT
jgi:hypothetical protein